MLANSGIPIPPERKTKGVWVPHGKNPFKLVACDMDGTLLSTKHTVSSRTRRVMAKLLARGVHFIFATGRPFTDVNRLKRRLNLFASKACIPTVGVDPSSPNKEQRIELSHQHIRDLTNGVHHDLPRSPSTISDTSIYLSPTGAQMGSPNGLGAHHGDRIIPRCFAITSNGACIYDETNTRVYEQCIHPTLCRELYNMFRDDKDVNINIFRGVDEADRKRNANYVNLSDQGDDKAKEEWISRYPADLEAALYSDSKFTFQVVPDLERTFPTDRVNEIFFLCYDPEKSMVVEKIINQRMSALQDELHLPSTVRVAPSAPHCLDIMPSEVCKASSLKYVAEQLGVSMNECVAFGDGMNDVEMLSSVGKGFVMGNASGRLRQTLPELEVIGTNDEDAVATKLMELFELSDNEEDDNWDSSSTHS